MKKPTAVFLSYLLALQTLLLAQAQAPPPQQPPAQTAPPAPAQTAPPAPTIATGTLNLDNASLTEVADQLCRTLRYNCVTDPRVKGSVTLHTYGDMRIDARNLLDLILRINGFTIVQQGDIYRIVPMGDASRMPLPPNADPSNLVPDEQTVLSLIFLKYASVAEVAKLIEPFIGEGAKATTYVPANLLLLLDSRRNVRRLMDIIGLFDSNNLAGQRVRLFEVKHGSPTAIAKDLEDVLKAISLTRDTSLVHFLPIDRINTIIAVAPNPGVFEEVQKWLEKLDTETKVNAGASNTYVYRVKYGQSCVLASSLMQLFGSFGMGGNPMMMGGYGGYGGGYGGGGMGGFGACSGGYGGGGFGGGGGGFGGGGFGGGFGGYGSQGGNYSGYPMGGYGGYGGYGGGMMPYAGGYAPQYPISGVPVPAGQLPGSVGAPGAAGSTDLTGNYLGANGVPGFGRMPRIIPNPTDNSLLIQATHQEYQQILGLLDQLDIPPRQVLVDAKIYEVSLTGAFASGVSAFLQARSANPAARSFLGKLDQGVTLLSAGTLVGQSRELLAFLSLAENSSRAKVLSAPSVIATDSIAASITVGTEVPTLTSQAVTPIQSNGSSLFANQIQSRSTGVTLNVMAHVTPSGIVTLMINQSVSAPESPAAGGIQSPSFSQRTINTQVTVQDGDTIAIGGIINESNSSQSTGIPGLQRLPYVGALFGSKSYSKERTELIVFMTPRVIYDINQVLDASEELKSNLKKLNKMVRE